MMDEGKVINYPLFFFAFESTRLIALFLLHVKERWNCDDLSIKRNRSSKENPSRMSCLNQLMAIGDSKRQGHSMCAIDLEI